MSRLQAEHNDVFSILSKFSLSMDSRCFLFCYAFHSGSSYLCFPELTVVIFIMDLSSHKLTTFRSLNLFVVGI